MTAYIFDEELREKFPDKAEIIIDDLDRNPGTQKIDASGKRERVAVKARLLARGEIAYRPDLYF